MAIILNFNLSSIASSIEQIICLYDPQPVFQYQQNADFTYSPTLPQFLNRDNNVASAGFSASLDFIGPVPPPGPTNIPLPANAYVLNVPSLVYNTPSSNDNYSVLQINTVLARIEPGFQRIRVDYTWLDAFNNVNLATQYFDCPFYEGFNVTARELNNVVSYVEGATGFLQKELDLVSQEISYALSHELWRGTSVSGQLQISSINQGLQTGALVRGTFSHDLLESDISAKGIGTLTQQNFVPTLTQMRAAVSQTGFDVNGNSTSSFTLIRNSTGAFNESYQSFSDTGGGTVALYIAEVQDTNNNLCFVVLTYDTDMSNTGFAAITYNIEFPNLSGVNGVYVAVDSNSPATSSEPNQTLAFTSGIGLVTPGVTTLSVDFGGRNPSYDTNAAINNRFVINSKIPYTQTGDNSSGLPYPNATDPANHFTDWSLILPAYADTVEINSSFVPRFILRPSANFTTLPAANLVMFKATNGGGGNAYVRQYNLNAVSTALQFLYQSQLYNPTPTISGVSPLFACVGDLVVVNGTNFSNQYSVYINNTSFPVSNLNFVSATDFNFAVPSGSPTGSVNILMYNSSNNTSVTVPFVIYAQPSITSVVPNTALPGTNITINGINFGPQTAIVQNSPLVQANGSVNFVNTVAVQSGTIVSWTDTQIIVTVPNIAQSAVQLTVLNVCGQQISTSFTVGIPITEILVVSPGGSAGLVLSESIQQQFSAIIQFSDNTTLDVTSSALFYVLEGPTFATQTTNGDAIYGTLSNVTNGLYTAPVAIPPGQTNIVPVIAIKATYTYNSMPLTAITTILINVVAQLVITPGVVTSLQAPQTQQFVATLNTPGGATTVTSGAQWYVNGVLNGNGELGIIYNGLYVPPVFVPPTEPTVISAQYVFDNSLYSATANVTVIAPPSTQAVLNVVSQINIFLGDGRFGYVPTGTTAVGYLNQYCYVQFSERLAPGLRLPDPTYLPIQNLSINFKNALDSDIANVMYNLADGVQQPDGSTITKRTVVLGFIDPSDGLFHSMWDIAIAPAALGGGEHSLALSDISKNITMNDIELTNQTQLDTILKRSNIMLIGDCQYDDQTHIFSILKPLHILGINDDTGQYGIIGVIKGQTLKIETDNYLYIDRNFDLKIGEFSNIFEDVQDVKTIVVGIVLDQFYTSWPIIGSSVKSDINSNNGQNWINIGQLIVQWGETEFYTLEKKAAYTSDPIKFGTQFMQSCTVLTEAIETNGSYPNVQAQNKNLEQFQIHVVNTQNVPIKTKVAWFAIGV
jgi:hypothetical protein